MTIISWYVCHIVRALELWSHVIARKVAFDSLTILTADVTTKSEP
jgi:hypothetical protein